MREGGCEREGERGRERREGGGKTVDRRKMNEIWTATSLVGENGKEKGKI